MSNVHTVYFGSVAASSTAEKAVATERNSFGERDARAMKWAAYGGGIAAFALVFFVIVPLRSEATTPAVDYPTHTEQVVQTNR